MSPFTYVLAGTIVTELGGKEPSDPPGTGGGVSRGARRAREVEASGERGEP